MEANKRKPPAVPVGLQGREQALAVEAASDFGPSIRDVFTAITAVSRTMVVREEIKADVAETLMPVYARLDAFDEGIPKLGAQTSNLNERVSKVESSVVSFNSRML